MRMMRSEWARALPVPWRHTLCHHPPGTGHRKWDENSRGNDRESESSDELVRGRHDRAWADAPPLNIEELHLETTIDVPIHTEPGSTRDVASAVERVPIVFVNAYLVGERDGPWVLVDTGLPGFAPRVRRAAESRFGGRAPQAIVLTHGHFDHAGSAGALAAAWDVPIYAHPLELPYLTGRSDYPPQDPTVGGALGLLSRSFPHRGMDLSPLIEPLPSDNTVPGLPNWRWLPTPGHTPGHVSLFRDDDRVLLAGDALATTDQDSAIAMVTQRAEFSVPPAPLTTDWGAAEESVRQLALLRPFALGAGHGRAVRGPAVADDLERFASVFPRPSRGRYARQPARADERGVLFVPPPVPDPLPRRLVLAGVGAAALFAAYRSAHPRR
jgi:glyoxylase-like metal-dependent hydrolase (beta-lactamase superfamily II)